MQPRMHRSALYLLAALMFLALVPLRSAVGQDLPDGADPASPATAAGTLSTSLNYQGQLQRSGSPYTGACSMQFGLWDAADAGTQIGVTLSFATVNVSTGAFTVALNFGADAFSGDGRWLATAVKCGTDTTFTPLTPRQAIAAIPYALSLRPGSIMRDALPHDSLYVENNAVTGNAIHGKGTADGGIGVWGEGIDNTGVYGLSGKGVGVWGKSTSGYGVYGESSDMAIAGKSQYGIGVQGEADNGIGVAGVTVTGDGVAGFSTSGNAVNGLTDTGWAIRGRSKPTGYAGYFDGRVAVNDTLLPYAVATRMDHPLDPANKTLSHAFIESPDMLNVYNGNITTDTNGDATVALPDYFESFNQDPRYQLTVVGQFAQAIVAEKVVNNQFKIKTDKPNVEVSWLVTGVRKDPYAVAHRIVPEEAKLPEERGRYYYPEGYGQPASMSIDNLSTINSPETGIAQTSMAPSLHTEVQP